MVPKVILISLITTRRPSAGRVNREERGGFTGIFEIVGADKARVGRVKRRPFGRGTSIAAPINPSPPLLPNQPSHPCLTQGANWGRQRYLNHSAGQLTTQRAMMQVGGRAPARAVMSAARSKTLL